MHTWTVSSTHTTHADGAAETRAGAWQAAHVAAAEAVRAGTRERMSLTVDDDTCSITPADTGEPEADLAACLEVIEAGRVERVAAHLAIEETA